MSPRFLLAFSLLLGACRSAVLTPATLARVEVDEAERADLVETWSSAVARCNEFLDSPFRRALPPGELVLDAETGMRFETEERTWPLEVRCTGWGDFVLWFGFQAQEGRGGFTVGEVPPERDRHTDNSFFCSADGGRMDPDLVADLILHELTHVASEEGAIGFWKSAGFYLETIFLLRFGRTHTDERRAYSTSEEYHSFIQSVGRPAAEQARLLRDLDEHVARDEGVCRHAPRF